MNEYTTFISIGASLLALYVAARTAFSQSRLQTRLLAIEEARDREREAEASAAQVEAEIIGGYSATRLLLHNLGEQPAHSIELSIDGKSAASHPQFKGTIPREFILAAFAKHSFPLLVYDGGPTHFRIEVKWTSAASVPGSWVSDVSIL